MTKDTIAISQTVDVAAVVDTYLASWNEQDAAVRAELIQRVWAETGRHVDPLGDARGHAALDEMVAGLRQQFPGHQVRRTTGIDTHHETFRFGWDLAGPDGTVVVNGTDVGALAEDGRIQVVAGFFGELSAD